MKTLITYASNTLEESVFLAMWQNTPTITVVLFAAMLSGFVVYKVMKFYARFEKIETKVPNQENLIAEHTKLRHESQVRFARIDAKLDMLAEKLDFLIKLFLDKNKSDR